ncbi:MAG TPA: phosphocholine cytidylyltransferase family protein, partial [Gammaproteobacteria bacterium]
GGKSLLQRHLENLQQMGVTEVAITVGYAAELIEHALPASTGDLDLELIRNPDYELGSMVSLWCARDIMTLGEPVLLMDADVLYSPSILKTLVQSRHASCLLIDRDFEPGDEPVKVPVRDGIPLDFGKTISTNAEPDTVGESVGFFRFSPSMARQVTERTEHYIRAGKKGAPHEEAIRDLVLSYKGERFGVEDITGQPWIEIDFPEDVERARDRILPAIELSSR